MAEVHVVPFKAALDEYVAHPDWRIVTTDSAIKCKKLNWLQGIIAKIMACFGRGSAYVPAIIAKCRQEKYVDPRLLDLASKYIAKHHGRLHVSDLAWLLSDPTIARQSAEISRFLLRINQAEKTEAMKLLPKTPVPSKLATPDEAERMIRACGTVEAQQALATTLFTRSCAQGNVDLAVRTNAVARVDKREGFLLALHNRKTEILQLFSDWQFQVNSLTPDQKAQIPAIVLKMLQDNQADLLELVRSNHWVRDSGAYLQPAHAGIIGDALHTGAIRVLTARLIHAFSEAGSPVESILFALYMSASIAKKSHASIAEGVHFFAQKNSQTFEEYLKTLNLDEANYNLVLVHKPKV